MQPTHMQTEIHTMKAFHKLKKSCKAYLVTATFGLAYVMMALAGLVATSHAESEAEIADHLKDNSCVSCHLNEVDDDNTAMTEHFLKGIHARRGVSCSDCHGGNPKAEDEDEAMDEDAGFIGAPDREEIPKFCAKCHSDPNYIRGFNPNLPTDQYAKYMISGHGKRLLKSNDDKVAVCTSCHGVHGILPPNDPKSPVYVSNIPGTCSSCHSDSTYMSGRHIPVDQLDEYKTSVHGIALLENGDRGAPSCTGCHGSHDARRPEPSGVANTCAQCHNFIREMFVASPHKAAFDEENISECEVCHGNHAIQKVTDDMLVSEDKSVCGECHDSDSKGWKVATDMSAHIVALRNQIDSITLIVDSAREIGMDAEDAIYILKEARNELVKSRALVHTFKTEDVAEVTKAGTEKVQEAGVAGRGLMEQFHFRKRGFLLSLAVILLLSVLLTLKIRSLSGSSKIEE